MLWAWAWLMDAQCCTTSGGFTKNAASLGGSAVQGSRSGFRSCSRRHSHSSRPRRRPSNRNGSCCSAVEICRFGRQQLVGLSFKEDTAGRRAASNCSMCICDKHCACLTNNFEYYQPHLHTNIIMFCRYDEEVCTLHNAAAAGTAAERFLAGSKAAAVAAASNAAVTCLSFRTGKALHIPFEPQPP